ncbi:MAG: serine hydrolase [Pseudomonadota bacterium]
MMKALLRPLVVVVILAALAAAWWYFRPGSEFSPREVIAFSEAPDRRPAYRMMPSIYPSRAVRPAAQPTTFARDERPIDFTWTWDGTERTLDDYVTQRNVQGIYVLKDRKVVYEEYFGEARADDQFTSWSVAKSVVSSLIGIALKEGVIASLDDEAGQYASGYAGTDYGATSIRHLLMMSSGIDFNENYEEPGSDIRNLFLNTFLFNRDVDKTIRQYTRGRAPGEVFDYISTDTQVLSAVLRGAYGKRLIDLFNEKLAAPLGITGGTWLVDRQGADGKELGYCCLQLTLEDYAKLGQLYAQGGRVGGAQILPPEWPAFVATAGTEDHAPPGEGLLGYGHHFWLIGGDEGAMTMQGYDGQLVHIDPDENVVIVIVSADRSHRDFAAVPEFVRLFQQVKAELR